MCLKIIIFFCHSGVTSFKNHFTHQSWLACVSLNYKLKYDNTELRAAGSVKKNILRIVTKIAVRDLYYSLF